MKPRHKQARRDRRRRRRARHRRRAGADARSRRTWCSSSARRRWRRRRRRWAAPSASAGMVETGSVKRDGVEVQLHRHRHRAAPAGDLPRLRCPTCSARARCVVAQGQLGADGVFQAREVLAKHDENYMPPEAKRSGREGAQRGEEGPAMIPELGQVALSRSRSRTALFQAIGAHRTATKATRAPRRRARRCWSRSPSAAWCMPSSPTTSRSPTSRRTRTRRCRCSTASPAPGAATKARCCSGC